MSIATTTELICFLVLSAVVVTGALGVVLLSNIVYSAFLLGGVFYFMIINQCVLETFPFILQSTISSNYNYFLLIDLFCISFTRTLYVRLLTKVRAAQNTLIGPPSV